MDTIRNDLKIENTCQLGNMIGRGGDGDRARKTCDYDTHLTRRRSLTLWPATMPNMQQLHPQSLQHSMHLVVRYPILHSYAG